MLSQIDLSQCEKEKIHIPNLIQPHGFIITFHPDSLTVMRYSSNLIQTQVGSDRNLTGRNIKELFPETLWKTVEKNLDFSNYLRHIIYEVDFPQISDQKVDIMVCSAGREVILELIPVYPEKDPLYSLDFQLNSMVRRVMTAHENEDFFHIAASEIKALTGYDRVMVYRFDEEFNGKVIAEAKEPEMVSYLNLHYPASDIPVQARDLYRKNMIRTIKDVNYTPVPIDSKYSDPLDMSHSFLRSVSPIHLEYLRNMGVAATLTISIMVNHELWGLIGCHHRTPFLPGNKRLSMSEIFGSILGGIIQMREENQNEKRKTELIARIDTVMEVILSQDKKIDLLDLIKKKIFLFQSIFPSDGFCIYSENSFVEHLFPYSKNEIADLLHRIRPSMKDDCFSTDHLASIYPDFTENFLKMCAGLMILRIDTHPESFWIWRRMEKRETISWGGDPNQKAVLNSEGIISPRKSFEDYNQVVMNKSISWDAAEKEIGRYLIPQIQRLFSFFESGRQLESQKIQIKSMEEEKARHYQELIEMLVDVIEQRDAYTAGHTRRVAYYSAAIAKEMNLNEESIDQIKEAAILHDIGKIIIPDSILLKPGKLSFKEYELIKKHLDVGVEILNKIDYYKPLAEIIKFHHEKYDGSGYPYKMKDDEISILSHIMIVADAFDAMTTNRIYQARKTVKEAADELMRYRGKWYHPDVVDAAVKISQDEKFAETATSQLPFTQMERERFAYFFKDQLTGLYNNTYLGLILNNLIPNLAYHYFVLIELHGMTVYNEEKGWHQGNIILQKFSELISKMARDEQIFRVFGDDFIIGFETENQADAFLKNWVPCQIETICATCEKIEKDKFRDYIDH